MHSEALKKKNE